MNKLPQQIMHLIAFKKQKRGFCLFIDSTTIKRNFNEISACAPLFSLSQPFHRMRAESLCTQRQECHK